MMNHVVLVGRVAQDLEIKELENERKVTILTLEVTRNFKNINGEYEKDLISCTLWNGIAETTKEYCKKGDVVGIKGRLQSSETKNGNSIEIIAEKVSFLSSK